MTRREFDAATKRNWEGHRMASDEYAGYRRDRCRPLTRVAAYGWFPGDKLARRGAVGMKPIHDRGELAGRPSTLYKHVVRRVFRLYGRLPSSIAP